MGGLRWLIFQPRFPTPSTGLLYSYSGYTSSQSVYKGEKIAELSSLRACLFTKVASMLFHCWPPSQTFGWLTWLSKSRTLGLLLSLCSHATWWPTGALLHWWEILVPSTASKTGITTLERQCSSSSFSPAPKPSFSGSPASSLTAFTQRELTRSSTLRLRIIFEVLTLTQNTNFQIKLL